MDQETVSVIKILLILLSSFIGGVVSGERFGKMQTKVGLTVMIKNYKFTLNPKTKVPLVMDTRSFIPTTLGGMWMDYEKV